MLEVQVEDGAPATKSTDSVIVLEEDVIAGMIRGPLETKTVMLDADWQTSPMDQCAVHWHGFCPERSGRDIGLPDGNKGTTIGLGSSRSVESGTYSPRDMSRKGCAYARTSNNRFWIKDYMTTLGYPRTKITPYVLIKSITTAQLDAGKDPAVTAANRWDYPTTMLRYYDMRCCEHVVLRPTLIHVDMVSGTAEKSAEGTSIMINVIMSGASSVHHGLGSNPNLLGARRELLPIAPLLRFGFRDEPVFGESVGPPRVSRAARVGGVSEVGAVSARGKRGGRAPANDARCQGGVSRDPRARTRRRAHGGFAEKDVAAAPGGWRARVDGRQADAGNAQGRMRYGNAPAAGRRAVQRTAAQRRHLLCTRRSGKVLVIGGAEMYTGAPFFSAMAALRTVGRCRSFRFERHAPADLRFYAYSVGVIPLCPPQGADLAYVVCERSAAPAIKVRRFTNQEESVDFGFHCLRLMRASAVVFPRQETVISLIRTGLFRGEVHGPMTEDNVVGQVSGLMFRMDVVVIGPGLGRDELTMRCVGRIIEVAKRNNKLLVLDGDALFLVHNRPELVKGYGLAVLTPNVVEFGRLCKSVCGSVRICQNLAVEDGGNANVDECDSGNVGSAASMSAKLARAFGGLTVVEKGDVDPDNMSLTTVCRRALLAVFVSDKPGGLKRCGGQGDLLTGCLAVWLLWAVRAAKQVGTHEESNGKETTGKATAEMPRLWSGKPASLVAAYGACNLVRAVSRRAYERVGRGVQASDMLEELPAVVRKMLDSRL
ncbi:MAG: Ribokinase-like protein [Olpidium bornovanus]|uniref:ATP-dependent (S)-NAD(P)H-hydrate dehydratase n=1 Tax=Olpidium bornovanus TaxID=278681 RepID=A0A8H8DHC0_9FUNG|nr:MAG: Ribokinase-like protein [Olpidium bornovanus]